jgi:hypothetical protein
MVPRQQTQQAILPTWQWMEAVSAVQIGTLRFSAAGELREEPVSYSHVVSTMSRPRYVEIKDMVQCQHTMTIISQDLLPYHACIGAASGALSQHVQRVMGDMRNFQLPPGQDWAVEVDIIITTDRSVLFGVG